MAVSLDPQFLLWENIPLYTQTYTNFNLQTCYMNLSSQKIYLHNKIIMLLREIMNAHTLVAGRTNCVGGSVKNSPYAVACFHFEENASVEELSGIYILYFVSIGSHGWIVSILNEDRSTYMNSMIKVDHTSPKCQGSNRCKGIPVGYRSMDRVQEYI